MPQPMERSQFSIVSCLQNWNHGLLYCIASLILGIQLNIVGPTVDSLAAQVGVSEAALGGVVGLGGIGLLVGGLPSGWLLDKLPGHTVLAGALALQAAAFLLLPHCAHLAVLAAAYCAAALTFNAITTGANALILWRYPASQGAWLNLASALFGVGCFLAPVLADLATMGGGGGGPSHPPRSDDDHPPGRSGGGGGPFALRGGPAALAYYAVAVGAATCCVWATCLPSPQRPQPHHHHHYEEEEDGVADGEHGNYVAGGEHDNYADREDGADQRENGHGRFGGAVDDGAADGISSVEGEVEELLSSPSFASVLDLGGLESPTAALSASSRPSGAAANVDPDAAVAVPTAAARSSGSLWGTSSTGSPDDAAASAAASPKASAAAAVAPYGAGGAAASTHGRPQPTAAKLPLQIRTSDGGSCSGGGGGSGSAFGSALSTSPPALDEAGAVAADQGSRRAAAGADRNNDTPAYGAGSGLVRGAVKAAAVEGPASDVLSAAAAQIKMLQQQQQKHGGGQQQPQQRQEEALGSLGSGAAPAAGGVPALEARAGPGVSQSPPLPTATEALFRRYLHELRMGWPVLLPVVLLLFANISTQASFGAWVTTYCQRAAGLDEAAAHAVTAAYWAAFTGTRMAAVALAPFLHASRVLLITSPFAVAGAGMAVLGMPQVSWLFPAASATAAGSAAGASTSAFAASLPLWALYVAVCLVGVGVSTGFANTVSLTGDHLQLDGFTNGILSSVAGLASTLCPAAVPWLAGHTRMGYGALMAVALFMSGLQLAMVVTALVGARWVDEWQRLEDEAEVAEELWVAEEEARRKRCRRGGGGSGSAEQRWRRQQQRSMRGQNDGVMVVLVLGGEEEQGEKRAEEGAAAGGKEGAGRGGVLGGGGSDLTEPLLANSSSC